MALFIFDASDGFPALCLGHHPVEGDDPVRVTGNRNAVGVVSQEHLDVPARYLSLDAPGGSIQVDAAGRAEDTQVEQARSGLGLEVDSILFLGLLSLLVRLVRARMPGLTPQEEAALDALVARLPTLDQSRTVLESDRARRAFAAARRVFDDLTMRES